MTHNDQRKRQTQLVTRLSQNGWRVRMRHKSKVWAWDITIGLARGLKRGLDILVSMTAMVVLFPLFLLSALAIYFENPGPVFYAQTRVGQNGRHFRFYKFRSMVVDADRMKSDLADRNESSAGVIFKMEKDPRITRVGRVIRKFSIDELPQLVNVLKGDMSLVGPRPPLPREVAQYTLEQRKRLHIRPGITCIWQVSGRSDIPFTDQVRLDLEYIQSADLVTDLVILLKTVPAVLTGKGAY
jgi:lipopolysaccharide/colanic/teichoic acid biosynthesis glycosyltransferase